MRFEEEPNAMRAIVTVVGPDRVGIIAEVCGLLARLNINIIDISQTVMEDFFTMMMLTDTAKATADFDASPTPWRRRAGRWASPSASSGRTSSRPCTPFEGVRHAQSQRHYVHHRHD